MLVEMAWVLTKASPAFLLALLYHLLELFFAQDNDLERKEAFAVAEALVCSFVTVVFGSVRIAIVKIVVVSVSATIAAASDSVATVVVCQAAMTAVASGYGMTVVASGFVMTAVVSGSVTTAVVSGHKSLTGASDFVTVVVAHLVIKGVLKLSDSSSEIVCLHPS